MIINFELCDAFFYFQNHINNMLYKYFDNLYIIYINNILIYNKNKEIYIKHIRFILTRFRKIRF